MDFIESWIRLKRDPVSSPDTHNGLGLVFRTPLMTEAPVPGFGGRDWQKMFNWLQKVAGGSSRSIGM